MSALQWRTAIDLCLIAEMIPAPDNPARLLSRLTGVRVAVQGSVLYVDTVQGIFAIPVASILFVAYSRN
ncbi:hypothetical protein ACEZCY_17965 [Streptacidiphilus sp. N1-12]|uniref:Uncharacterized protein n=2 Tax=Streptacidiphilus alkalitolerans TaxID=3342712 RepID=A0ABN2J6E6_9ACTN